MTCTCDFDEYGYPKDPAGCPVHDRPMSLSERLYTLAGRFAQLLSRS